jgi:hypothetical protein
MTANVGLVVLVILGLSATNPGKAASTWDDARLATKKEIVEAMQHQQRQGYALDAISNAVRLQLGVFLALTEAAQAADPQRRPLRVGHKEYFAAFLEVTGHTPGSAPKFATVPHQYGEDFLIDYRMQNVIARIERGKVPLRALNVKAGWPAAPGAPSRYSYEDTTSKPNLEVTHEQLNGYRILDFGNAIVYDDMRGITGRATSGVLGFIFKLLGKAQAVQTRFVVADDGMQVSRTTARKLFTITQTVTIFPDGTVLPGLPENRPDLERLEARLTELDFQFIYAPFDLSPVPPPAIPGEN